MNKKRKLLVTVTLVLVFCTLILNMRDIIRFAWHYWNGGAVEWKGSIISVYNGYFVFPKNRNNSLVIGYFDDSSRIFPDSNIIIAAPAKEGVLMDKLQSTYSRLCKKINCTNYKEYVYVEGNSLIGCVEFEGSSDILYEYRKFHVFCSARFSNIIVEYHGDIEAYSTFEKQLRAVVRDTMIAPHYPQT